MGHKDIVKALKDELERARRFNHRRLVVISGPKVNELTLRISKSLFRGSRLYVYDDHLPEALELKEELEHLGFETLVINDSEEAMGTTQDFLVLDLRGFFTLNDVGKLCGTVRGGGALVLLTPDLGSWKRIKYHEKLVTPPYTIGDIKGIFLEWFKKSLRMPGTIVIESGKGKIKVRRVKEREIKRKRIVFPRDSKLPLRAYEMCATQDQVNVLHAMERFQGGYDTLVLTANRGRGKSAALGIALAFLDFEDVIITAPNFQNAKTLFQFLIEGLKRRGKKVRVREDDGFRVRAGQRSFRYMRPFEALDGRAELIVVDEAASLQIPMLFRLLDRFKRGVFSSTIHGYEGAGRGFSIRFLGRLKERKAKVMEVKMEEPIRYASNDPLEEWSFKTLLLDAEPAKVGEIEREQVEMGELKFEKPDLREWFLRKREELEQYFGILILAHYRNNPNDLLLLADAPHHEARVVKTSSGKIVCAIQIAREGGLEEEHLKGEKLPGNLIPDRIYRHFFDADFPKLKGLRIVRIATHPELMNLGIGSFALRELEKEDVDWIGAGFGVTHELLKFWLKNGFVPIHVSPSRNPVSGEYSVIVVKPLSEPSRRAIEKVNFEFRVKFVETLHDPYFDMEPEVAHLLLTPFGEGEKREKLSAVQFKRLLGYLDGIFTYETAADAVKRVVRQYFISNHRFLSPLSEKILIHRVLQGKTWKKCARTFKLDREALFAIVRKALARICKRMELEVGC